VSPRPYWKGYLKLSLVSCPVALHVAWASSERISFRQINRKTGNRLRQQLIDEETREPVDGHDKARGYEIGKGQYLLVEDAELEAVEIESTRTIDIDNFVPGSEIDRRFFDTPYYITPNDPVGQDAFAVIREAMRSKALVALGRVLLAKRERAMALEPYDKGLIGTTLRSAPAKPCSISASGCNRAQRHAGARLRPRSPQPRSPVAGKRDLARGDRGAETAVNLSHGM
jgi:DNA end-binding protein Ku